MKKYLLSAFVVCSATIFTSCDDMLDTDPRVTDATQATFPGKIGDVEALNTATYSIMNTMGGGDADTQNPFYWWEIMSDNCYGAGGLQDNKVKALHHLVEMNSNQYEQAFVLLYGGINRANNQIATIDNVKWTDNEEKRNQLLGEGYFMRGLYTLWLTQLFGDVPLITSTTITEEMKAEADAETVIYPQIISDFVSAKNLMSGVKNSGHANKYVAEAFLARAYMFWAGFYKKVGELASGSAPAITLVEQEGCKAGTLTQADVVAGLKDVVGSGSYKLLKDYRSLWQYSNSKLWDEAHDGVKHAYWFIEDMDRNDCFDMPGNGNGNDEELFQIQFMNASRWGIGKWDGQSNNGGVYSAERMYCNYLSVFWALRVNGNNGNRDYTYPFTQGWGQGTPSCNIWDDWTNAEEKGGYTDIRKLGSLIDCEHEFSSEHGLKGYSYVKDDCEESGYGVKKYNGVTLDALTGDSPWWDAVNPDFKGTLENPMQGDHFEDFYLMRYADVLLMLTELTGDASYMNQVQRRAGVPETAYSLKAVQDERRWEFAFEGIRFNDMRRWSGKDSGESSYAAQALEAQAGKKIVVKGNTSDRIPMKHMTCSWKKRYADTNGFLAKPQNQINLMNGNLKQNPGWEASNSETQYVDLYN